MKGKGRVAVCWLLLAIQMGKSPQALGCAAAPHRGELVTIDKEEAFIIYDSQTKTEHFVRRSQFGGSTRDFGFIVPTPSQPELGEARDAFETLANWTAARRQWSGKTIEVKRTKTRPRAGGHAADRPGFTRAAPKPVAPEIIERKLVGGYDAVVLKASDSQGLNEWLAKNEYDTREPLLNWLTWYVEHGWYLTAFKVAPSGASGWGLNVRMSFQTDRPLYPYREPAEASAAQSLRASPRQLRIFFLSDARYEATLGDAGRWAGATPWSQSVKQKPRDELFFSLQLAPEARGALAARDWWLTEFEDYSSPRLGTDEVYFRVAGDQTTVERPPIIYDEHIYVDVDAAEDSLPAKPSVVSSSENAAALSLWLWSGVSVSLVIAIGAVILVTLRRRKAAAIALITR